MDCWLEVMDWLHLHTLKLGWPNVGKQSILAALSAANLSSVRNVTLIGGTSGGHTTVLELLENTSLPLEAVSLQSMT